MGIDKQCTSLKILLILSTNSLSLSQLDCLVKPGRLRKIANDTCFLKIVLR